MQENILPIEFKGDYIRLLDQTSLPTETKFLEIRTLEQMYNSIKKLEVRGAPAIGIAAAYGLALSMNRFEGENTAFFEELQRQKNYLAQARPTAVNLFWALNRVEKRAFALKDRPVSEIKQALIDEAKQIEAEEEASCLAIGENLLTLLEDGMGILTHCNAGGIATIRYGTALAPILLGQERGIRFKVYADETRPLLQGSR